jgi:hypothetical protein
VGEAAFGGLFLPVFQIDHVSASLLLILSVSIMLQNFSAVNRFPKETFVFDIHAFCCLCGEKMENIQNMTKGVGHIYEFRRKCD